MASPRRAYDMDWISGDCKNSSFTEYDIKATTTDNLFWTYMTNYAIGMIGVVACAYMIHSVTRSKCNVRFAAFFGLTGIGYMIAGVGHQYFYVPYPRGTEAEDQHEWAEKLSYVFVLLGNAALSLIAVHVSVDVFPVAKAWEDKLDRCMLIVNAFIGGNMWTSSPPNDTPVGVICLLVNFVLICLWLGRKQFLYAASQFLMVAGFLVQLGLHKQCGDDSYANRRCWNDCPLPTVRGWEHPFNHNALYHTIYAIAMVLLAAVVCRPEELTIEKRSAPAHGSNEVQKEEADVAYV